jgi:hypothetical protein
MAVTTRSAPAFTVPYLTIDEYKRAPTAVDVGNLARGGSQAQQDAELANVIVRASAWVNGICNQNLAATRDTENGRVRVNRAGEYAVHPRYWPILEVVTFAAGSSPSALTNLDLTNCFIEEQLFTIPSTSITSGIGPALQFGATGFGDRAFAQWTYVNGWAVTTLATVIAAAGATSVVVRDATGIYAGTRLTIYDAENTETFTVTSLVGTTLTVPALTFAHATAGVSISALPGTVKEAAVLLTSSLVKSRGNEAVVMAAIDQQPATVTTNPSATRDAQMAKEMLIPFGVVR